MSSGKRVAKTDGKLKKAAGAVWSFVKGYLSFSKLLVFAVLYIDYKSTMTTLDLCYIAVANNYTGSLPYLTALIAFLQAATATPYPPTPLFWFFSGPRPRRCYRSR